MDDFKKYARSQGINSLVLDDYRSEFQSYVSPTIIEERKLNVAAMDVFSRLMMDRIIFLGSTIALRKDSHTRIDFLLLMLPERGCRSD